MTSYESYVDLIQRIDGLVAAFEKHPDPSTREKAVELLQGLDSLHREGLRRLIERMRDAGAGELVDHAASDPVVAVLLGLYDLADLDLPDVPDAPPPGTGFVPIEELTMRRKP